MTSVAELARSMLFSVPTMRIRSLPDAALQRLMAAGAALDGEAACTLALAN